MTPGTYNIVLLFTVMYSTLHYTAILRTHTWSGVNYKGPSYKRHTSSNCPAADAQFIEARNHPAADHSAFL